MYKIEKTDKMKLLSDEAFKAMVNKHEYMSDIIREIGMSVRGTAYQRLRKRMNVLGIDQERFRYNSGNGARGKRKTDNELFVVDTCYNANMKKRIIDDKLIPYCCEKCENLGIWKDDKLVLQLDHINGEKTDNRLENLRFLCPNCHSQTETYAGNRFVKKHNYCKDCSVEIATNRTRCEKCRFKYKAKIPWPTVEQIAELVWQKSTQQLAKELKVSDSAIGKFCKNNNIPKPPRGFWAKKHAGK